MTVINTLVLSALTLVASCVHHPEPKIVDTDWEKIYEQELLSSYENDDLQAYTFYWSLYLQERSKKQLRQD